MSCQKQREEKAVLEAQAVFETGDRLTICGCCGKVTTESDWSLKDRCYKCLECLISED